MSAEFKFRLPNVKVPSVEFTGSKTNDLKSLGVKTPKERDLLFSNYSSGQGAGNLVEKKIIEHNLRTQIIEQSLFGEIEDLPPLEIPDNMHSHNVGMDESVQLQIPAGDTGIHSLATIRRSGCDAVLIWNTDTEGNDTMFMTHYPPPHMDAHREDIKGFSVDKEGSTRAVIVTVSDEFQDWTVPLQEDLKEAFGVTPDIVRLPMPTDEDMQQMNQDKTAYQLSAVKGYNGDSDKRRITVPKPFSKGCVYEVDF